MAQHLSLFGTDWKQRAGTSSAASAKGSEANSSAEKATNAERRKQDYGYYNTKPKGDCRNKTKQRCSRAYCGCKSNLAKHKKTRMCLRFFVYVHNGL